MSNAPQEVPASVPPRDDEALGDALGEERVHRILVGEVGEDMAQVLARARRAQEQLETERRPAEGLRERKRRLTRQRISDVATTLFAVRGFDNVKVSEVAETVGVSEKTVYNYFPTKESMVLDQADESIERLAGALRHREPGESVTDAVLRALQHDNETFDRVPDEVVAFVPLFAAMVASTPSLTAALIELRSRVAAIAAEELAARAEVDPRDPEPQAAGLALAGLGQIAFDARVRYIERGLRGAALRDAVNADIARAARLLETGLWSFDVLARGRRSRDQIKEAVKAAEEARAQVLRALRQARSAWGELRRQG
ncbi:MAG: TetR family transcriptional regulator [Solirubrobacterales bacterium]|nr:TetR family transcriptional regulator [Solirubrobacterales bacterium]